MLTLRLARTLPICLFAAAGAGAQIEADNFSATVTLTSDYVYRGVSQSSEDPAIQGSFSFETEAGFIAGLWASSVQFPTAGQRDSPRDLELDYFVGYRLDLGPAFSGEVGVTHYSYPGADTAFDYDYSEVRLTIGFEDAAAAAVAFADDAFGHGEESVSYELLGRLPLGGRLEAVAGVGYYDLQQVFGDSYLYWSLDLSRVLGRFTLSGTYIDTGGAAETIWGSRLTGERLVVSLSASIH